MLHTSPHFRPDLPIPQLLGQGLNTVVRTPGNNVHTARITSGSLENQWRILSKKLQDCYNTGKRDLKYHRKRYARMDILLKSRKPIANYIHERAQSTCQLPVNDMECARERGIGIIKKFSGI